MHRFFLPPGSISGEEVHFPAETARQIHHVLRLQPGQDVIVLDNLGGEFTVSLTRVDARQVSGQVSARRPVSSEPDIHLTLYIALTQREKFELILQKCTEIGAAAFVPVISARSLVQDPAEANRKLPRWQAILREAAEQSSRGRIPDLAQPLRFEDAIRTAGSSHDLALIPWEQEAVLSLHAAIARAALPAAPRLAVLIGPEGGWAVKEVELARQHHWLPVTLGPRILRMETAALVSAALILLAPPAGN